MNKLLKYPKEQSQEYTMPKFYLYLTVVAAAFVSFGAHATIGDNRYLPFIPIVPIQWMSFDGTRSVFSMDGMFATANKAVNDAQADIGIPELSGKLDEQQLGQAIALTGKANPLRSEWQGIDKIPWSVAGKLQMQGISFFWRQAIVKYLSIGFSWLFMNVNSRPIFKLEQNTLFAGPGDIIELDATLRAMFNEINVQEGNANQTGIGDIDAFIALGNKWEYTHKMRSIDINGVIGLLIPTGVKHDIYKPTSIPFGGNGHWGMYFGFNGFFEFREDLTFGFLARLNKRFARTSVQRMPAHGEPDIFGAIVGKAKIKPGVTGIFSPFLIVQNLRKGLGLSLQYTLTAHQEDDWIDMREDKDPIARLGKVDRLSEWASDYATVNVFYDFGKVKIGREFDPIVSLRWDIPALLFITKNVCRTQKISLGIEFAY